MKSILLASLVGLAAAPSAPAADKPPDCEHETERSAEARAGRREQAPAQRQHGDVRRNATAIPDAELIGRHVAL